MLITTPDKEIIERATHRTVMAMIEMVAPQESGKPLDPKTMGLIVEGGKPLVDVRATEAFIQATHVWIQEDQCNPKVAGRPDILEWSKDLIKSRRKNIAQYDDSDVRRATFESEDVIFKATGVERHMSFEFGLVAVPDATSFDDVPFIKLKTFLGALEKQLNDIGGHVYRADVEHAPAIKGADYYAQAFNRLHMGRRFTYGDIMLSNAHNLLGAVGMPLVTAGSIPKKSLN